MKNFIVLLVNTLLISPICGFAVPIYDIQPISEQDRSIRPCGPNEPCWGYIAAAPSAKFDGEDLMHEDPKILVQTHRRLSMEENLDALGNENSEIRPAAPVIRQISSRPVKKDVFLSRNWGAGGMPFSVLYMNPHTSRQNHPTPDPTKQKPGEQVRKFPETSQSSGALKNPNNRIFPRNGASGQPRRQYSIIPQLFISYGWGPLGK